MTLGQKIKKLRANKGLTQKDLADQVHVTFQTVSKWEKDENEPDISTLRELAKIFDSSVDYLISEDELEEPKQELVTTSTEEEKEEEPVTKTIVIHQKEMHVCVRCKKDIPEGDIALDNVCVRHGTRSHPAEYRTDYYHKDCYKLVQRERAEAAARKRAFASSSAKKKSFGWGIAGGVIALGIALGFFLGYRNELHLHPALAVLFSVLVGYAIFAMLYCIISGSYIGDVFVWCAGLTVRFPGLIFTWDLDGFMWLIGMKILFAVLGFLIGVAAFILAVVLSAALGGISFPFVLIHNIRTDYEDAI